MLSANYAILRKDQDMWSVFWHTKLLSPNNFEIITAEVDSSFVLCLIYCLRNANNQFNSSLLSYFSSFNSTKNNFIIGNLKFVRYIGTHIAVVLLFWWIYRDSLQFKPNSTCNGSYTLCGNTLDIALTSFDGVYHVDTIKNLPLNLFFWLPHDNSYYWTYNQ